MGTKENENKHRNYKSNMDVFAFYKSNMDVFAFWPVVFYKNVFVFSNMTHF